MSSSQRSFGQRMRHLGWLRISLIAGAAYDFIFAFLMVCAPKLPSQLLELPTPGASFWLWINAVFLLMLGSLYLFAARDPRRYAGIVLVAAVGRTLGAVVLGGAALMEPAYWGLYPLAATDLLFGLAHAFFGYRALR